MSNRDCFREMVFHTTEFDQGLCRMAGEKVFAPHEAGASLENVASLLHENWLVLVRSDAHTVAG